MQKVVILFISGACLASCAKTYTCTNEQGIKSAEVKTYTSKKAKALCPEGTTAALK